MEEYDERALPEGERKTCPHCGFDQDAKAQEAYQLPPGTVLEGKYIVGRVLGAGGFGVTYIGYDASLERTVAIKEYMPGDFATRVVGECALTVFPGDPAEQFAAGLKSFIEEARRLAALSDDPGIVSVYDSFAANSTGYIVMEYLKGRTVKEALKADGAFSCEAALSIVYPVLDALESVHAADLVHRDIAPDNIFICADGSVRLIDFGASRYATTLHSKSLSVILKPGYAPEEQYRSKGVQGPFTDVYATAATLYKMLTGQTPEDAMDRAIEDGLKPPSKLGAELPKHVENAIMNALNVHAADRYQTAAAFKEALASEGTEREVVRTRRPDSGRLPLWTKIAAGVVAVGIAALVLTVATGIIDIHPGGMLMDSSVAFADGYMNTPDLVNLTSDQAKSASEQLGLYYLISDKKSSEAAPADRVLSQNPDTGTRIYQGNVISVVISSGPAQEVVQLVMPDVVYMNLDDAKALLDEAGIAYTVGYAEHDFIVEGGVISQSVPAGTEVDGDQRVDLVVSLGSDKQRTAIAQTADASNQPADPLAGTSTKTAAKQDTQSQNSSSSTAPASDQSATDTPASSGTAAGTQDKAASSKKTQAAATPVEKKAAVPSVVGSSLADAQGKLSAAGLVCNTIRQERIGSTSGTVLSQSLSAGTEVTAGTSVTIVVSAGEPAWSDWMLATDLPAGVSGSSNYVVENRSDPVTEYRFCTQTSYVDKTTNTTGSTPSGYTLYDQRVTSYNVGGWSASTTSTTKPGNSPVGGYDTMQIVSTGYTGSGFGGWTGDAAGNQPADVYTNGICTKQYESYSQPVYAYKTQYYYNTWRYLNGSTYYYTPVNNHAGSVQFTYGWSDTALPFCKTTDMGASYGPANGMLWFNPQTRSVQYQSGTQNWYHYRTQSAVQTYTYQTRSVTPVTTYYYQRTIQSWSAWSDWSTDPVQATDTRQVETRQGTPTEYARFRPVAKTLY